MAVEKKIRTQNLVKMLPKFSKNNFLKKGKAYHPPPLRGPTPWTECMQNRQIFQFSPRTPGADNSRFTGCIMYIVKFKAGPTGADTGSLGEGATYLGTPTFFQEQFHLNLFLFFRKS